MQAMRDIVTSGHMSIQLPLLLALFLAKFMDHFCEICGFLISLIIV